MGFPAQIPPRLHVPRLARVATYPVRVVVQCVLMDMVEHFYRSGAPSGGAAGAATSSFGLVFGVQSGLKVELLITSEMRVDTAAGTWTVDDKFATVQRELGQWRLVGLWRSGWDARLQNALRPPPSPLPSPPSCAVSKVFPTYELLGWYAIGTSVGAAHVAIHRQVAEWNESPILLLLDPAAVEKDARRIPLAAYIADYRGERTVPSAVIVASLTAHYCTASGRLMAQARMWFCHRSRTRSRRRRWSASPLTTSPGL